MILAKVEYSIFQSEQEYLNKVEKNAHELDKEIRLVNEAGERTFISWQQDGNDNHIATGDCSFFTGSDLVLDVSASKYWHDLIGHQISLSFLFEKKQVLQVGTESSVVFLCSYETIWGTQNGFWGADTIHVCRDIPAGLGDFLNE